MYLVLILLCMKKQRRSRPFRVLVRAQCAMGPTSVTSRGSFLVGYRIAMNVSARPSVRYRATWGLSGKQTDPFNTSSVRWRQGKPPSSYTLYMIPYESLLEDRGHRSLVTIHHSGDGRGNRQGLETCHFDGHKYPLQLRYKTHSCYMCVDWFSKKAQSASGCSTLNMYKLKQGHCQTQQI
jgi:hypothetical protein